MFLVPQVQAQSTFPESTTIPLPNAFNRDWNTFLTSILNAVVVLGVLVVFFYLLWGGFEWITSGGDKGKTENARSKITNAIIGLVILVAAWAILSFVQDLLGIEVLDS